LVLRTFVIGVVVVGVAVVWCVVLLSRALGWGRWIVLLILLIALGRRGFLLLWWWGLHLLIRWRQLRCPWGDHQRDRHL
jgi:hypothetical protein